MPIFIINEEIGSASKFWLSESLESLNRQLNDCLSSFSGSAANVIEELIRENDIREITWNRGFDRKSLSDEAEVKKIAKKYNVKVFVYNSSLLLAPEQTLKKDGTPYRVFTPFYKNNYLDLSFPCSNVDIKKLSILSVKSNSKVENVRKNLMSESNWYKKFNRLWQPGEDGAIMTLKKFIEQGLIGYGEGRNRPDLNHVSKLSPHIHFGEISPSRIAYALQKIDTIDKEKFYLFQDSIYQKLNKLCRNFDIYYNIRPSGTESLLRVNLQYNKRNIKVNTLIKLKTKIIKVISDAC